ncbi:MAG: DUF2087 domain-containing protein [Rhodoglobus sp.]
MTGGRSGDPRQIAALLANPDMRRAYAQIVLGHEVVAVAAHLNPSRRKRVFAALIGAGLVIDSGDGNLRDNEDVFRSMLAAFPVPVVATGIDRFVRNGRIDRYPSNLDERRALLEWVANKTIANGEVIDEKEINERLKPFSEDFAVLRRYLVDFEIVERTSSGTSYALVAEDTA